MSDNLYSWGRYPPHPQTAIPCHWRADIRQALADRVSRHGTLLPFGNGRSYGDSCLAASDQVLYMRPLDRFIAANWETGLIRAEAGVTLDEVLAVAIPKGWFLPVTPGTRFITLGGALANDVHGKNHHIKGTFGRHVPRFGLVRSDRDPLVCSTTENPEFYAATIGGLGLTGIIDWVELQLAPIRSSLIDATNVRFGSLDEFFAISAELDPSHEFTVSWIDCLARGKSAGRGIYMAGNHAEEGPLAYEDNAKLNVPFTPPFSAINQLSLRLFNNTYYRAHRAGRHNSRIGYEPFFYPLDRILNWNRIYGPRGFQQYQCAIPDANAAAATKALLDAIAAAHSGSFLAVLKRFGDVASPGLLSFPLPGATLALDFPQRGKITANLFARLDAIVREAGGRQYPAKDAHMSGADFRGAYPAFEQMITLSDPVISSRFWRRVTT
ncbi:MAG: FAD-binding oxidoreductase [Gallionellaceae bacterium]|nr:FAD-binding oxidoreductase [Gallionellaceae bacterium]